MPIAHRTPLQLLQFLYLLARMQLKSRYKGRFLGYVGSVATTFALAFVFWTAFKIIMGVEIPNYSVYLVTGLFAWSWMQAGVVGAARSFVANAPMVREMGVAHAILPLSNVVAEAIHFSFALPLIMAWIVVPGGREAALSWIWQLPLMMLLQTAFVFPLALVCALANAYVRDLDSLLGAGFLVLFFVTPMVYPIAMVPPGLAVYFELNPFHALMESWRAVFLDGTLDAGRLVYACGFAAAANLLAWLAYRRLAPRIGEMV